MYQLVLLINPSAIWFYQPISDFVLSTYQRVLLITLSAIILNEPFNKGFVCKY